MMGMVYWLVVFVMFFSGAWGFCFNRKHLLVMLLSLEFIVLSLFYGLFLLFNYFEVELYFSMVFLTFSVCEGALGLSILVSMIRTHGNDFFQSFSILQC
uniref:NADH-ubiquinone oxidoreductase chain 4L n=1 Tax=Pseudorhynchus crassiceps TaxID=1945537 RepID=A0A1Q1MPL0_9ORTH|nr:NADH dehydrogenase subunit 4L [Pseudorhynchus crassiceps]AQM40027.1 NADH dehydrogenase subunit 4L [Pseudorhynchus crassiceps]